jgi:hypothetical protein
LACLLIAATAHSQAAKPAESVPPGGGDGNAYSNTHPYLDQPPPKLVKLLPELETMQPVSDQAALPTILEKTGNQVDGFMDKLIDLTTDEEIKEEKLGAQGEITETLQVKDNYFIVRGGSQIWERLTEYRMAGRENSMPSA